MLLLVYDCENKLQFIISIGSECEIDNKLCQCYAKLCGRSGCQPVIQVDRAALPQSANSDVLAVVLDRFWIVGSLSGCFQTV